MTTTTIPQGAVTITRRQAHDARACAGGTRRVLNYLRERDGRIPRKDEAISLRDVADVLGVDGVIWCLDAMGEDRVSRMFAVGCARRALRAADVRDPSAWRALRVTHWYAHGWASSKELADARVNAQDGWHDAKWSATYAATDAATRAAEWASKAAANRAGHVAVTTWCPPLGPFQSPREQPKWHEAWDAERDAQLHLLLSMAGYGGEA